MTMHMRLYRHSARCPVALRAFLDCNPMYWCFIPRPWDDGMSENYSHFRQALHAIPGTNRSMANSVPNNQALSYYLDLIPEPPDNYVFSFRQRQDQRAFFTYFLSYTEQQTPYIELDLYKYAIIAVCK